MNARDESGKAGRAPLRIMMVSDEWPPYFGGAGKCMEMFARELTERGHKLMAVSAWDGDAPEFEIDQGISVHRIREVPSRMRWVSENRTRHSPAPFPDPEAAWRIRRLLNEFRPDVIPAYGWMAHSAMLALGGSDVPLILWGHDYANFCAMRTLYRLEREICTGPAPAKCFACSISGRGVARGSVSAASVLSVTPLLGRRIAAIHGVSRYVTAAMSRHLNTRGVPAVTIPNFHDDHGADPGVVDADVIGALPERDYVLFVGSLSRVKGVSELAEAYAQLADPPPLVMAGPKTPDSPSLPASAITLGSVSHATVMALWKRALFGVFPSKWPEPLATVVHEAMSQGRPVIGTKPGGYEDMIEDGRSGIIVPAGDVPALAGAMARLLDEPELRERMGQAALERSSRFTRDVVVPELESFYYETVESSKAGRH